MDSKLAASLEDLEQLFNSRMSEYENKLEKASSGTAPALDITTLSQEFNEFKTFVWQALFKFKSQMETLSLGFDRHETMMRRKVLLFHGVAEQPNEKLLDVVHKIVTDQLCLSEVGKDSIHVCHRLGSSLRKSRPILVRLYTTEHRLLIWDSKKALKGTGITISEFLTHIRHQTFIAARKHFSMKNCWSVEGRIVIITPDKRRHKIETPGDLSELITRFPQCSSDSGEVLRPEEHSSPSGVRTTEETTVKAQRKARRGRN